jgi:DNA-binding XRE family transcriptional regulator
MEKEKMIDLIVDYRVRNNLTMRQMAELCGITYNTLFNIENGKYKTQRTTIRKILNVIESEVL